MDVNIRYIRNFIGNGFFFSTILGIYYFIIFTHYEGIPFPLNSSSLPTIFSSLGILGIFLTGIFLFYSSMSIMIIADPFRIDYHSAFYKKTFCIENKKASSIANYFIFFISPSLFLYALFVNDALSGITFTGFIIMPLLFSIHLLSDRRDVKYHENKANYFAKLGANFITFVYLGFFSIISYSIFYSYITFTVGFDSPMNFIIASLVFFTLNYFIISPQRKRNGYELNAKKYSKDGYIKDFISTPAAPIYIIGFILSLYPDIAFKNATKVFALINAGGGIERSYYFSKSTSPQNTLPNEFIKECRVDLCITKPLKVVLDTHDIIYVRGNFEGHKNSLVSIQNKNMQVIIKPKDTK
ncbi:hypothetical protein JD515_19595 [Aeromonas caviae]|uniref:hypothetical protein n=1 Tax=Aeromonas caviae TaxID=648 RepID=UPI00191EBB60|nr:hypothetical protein [Aeromonas caviae]MBL0608333.1 hypothetical protein [Aeromonas caviae]